MNRDVLPASRARFAAHTYLVCARAYSNASPAPASRMT
jgi:hypothetical protein